MRAPFSIDFVTIKLKDIILASSHYFQRSQLIQGPNFCQGNGTDLSQIKPSFNYLILAQVVASLNIYYRAAPLKHRLKLNHNLSPHIACAASMSQHTNCRLLKAHRYER